MRGGSVTAVRQYDLEKLSIIIEFCRLRHERAVQVDATLTEERMQKVIIYSREIRVIQSHPVRLCKFTANIEFYI